MSGMIILQVHSRLALRARVMQPPAFSDGCRPSAISVQQTFPCWPLTAA